MIKKDLGLEGYLRVLFSFAAGSFDLGKWKPILLDHLIERLNYISN